jgi:hypothetical protein
MDIQTPDTDGDPYTDADIAAIIAAPNVPMTANMNPWLDARLQHIATMETAPQHTTKGQAGCPNRAGNWTWELAQLFGQCFGQQNDEPFVGFYREASRRLIESEYVRDKGFDLNYLLFEMKQGKLEDMSNGTILRTLREQRENAES